MTALFGDEPIITIGRTDADGQQVDFWVGSWPNSAASLHRGGACTDSLVIKGTCPNEWLPGIIGIWQLLGDSPDADVSMHATHRLNTDRWAATTLDPIVVPSSTGGTE